MVDGYSPLVFRNKVFQFSQKILKDDHLSNVYRYNIYVSDDTYLNLNCRSSTWHLHRHVGMLNFRRLALSIKNNSQYHPDRSKSENNHCYRCLYIFIDEYFNVLLSYISTGYEQCKK